MAHGNAPLAEAPADSLLRQALLFVYGASRNAQLAQQGRFSGDIPWPVPDNQRQLPYYGYDPPQPPVAHAPRRSRHADGKACYDPDGKFIGADNEDCGHDPNSSPEALPGTREWVEPE
jgi:hypothetical protein